MHFSIEEKLRFTIYRNSKIRAILKNIQTNDSECLQRDLVSHTEISRSLVSYYIKILRNNGIFAKEKNQVQISLNLSPPQKKS